MKDISIIVVDDHKLFREGLCHLLSALPDVKNVYQAENGLAFMRQLNSNTLFDIVFMDIAMPEQDGVQTVQQALQRYPGLKIIALSMHSGKETYEQMMELGCKGYMLKNSSFDQIKDAINSVYRGEQYICSQLQEIKSTANTDDASVSFTQREIEIIQLIAKGQTSQNIAHDLSISKKTVDKHRENIFIKSHANNSIDLIIYAIKHQIIDVFALKQ